MSGTVMKRGLVIGLLVSLALPVSAFDIMWGGRLDLNIEAPEIQSSTFGAQTENTGILWFRGSFGPAATIEIDGGVGFDATAWFGVDLNFQPSFHEFDWSVYPILDAANVRGNIGAFGYRAGRRVFSDPGRMIVDDAADGADVSYRLASHRFSAGLSYTGLAFRESSDYAMTQSDLKNTEWSALPRLYEYAAWSWPGALPFMDVDLFFLAMQDLTPTDRLALNTRSLSAQYLQARIRGQLGAWGLYGLTLVGQSGRYGDDVSLLAGAGRLEFSLLTGARSRIGVDVTASTGDGWDRGGYLVGDTTLTELRQYQPISTVSSRGYVVELEMGNLTSLAAFYNVKSRAERFAWELRATTFLRSEFGYVSSPMFTDTDQGAFLGQEASMAFRFRPASDFGWALNLGVLYPGSSLTLDSEISDYLPVLFRLGFDFSLSF